MGKFEETVEEIADAGLLTEKQAVAYLAREVDHSSREQVASYLDIKPNTLDNHRRAAIDKLEAAEETLELIDEYETKRYPDPPEACSKCGGTIGGVYVQDDDGNAICSDCSDIDPTEFA